MSVIQAPHGVTYSPKEAEEYIWLPALTVSGLEEHFKVVTDVNSQTQVIYIHPFDKITQRDSGCEPQYSDRQLKRTEKFWNPRGVEMALKQCYQDLYGSSLERTLRAGTERPTLEGTETEAIILKAMVQAGAIDLQRIVWLAQYNINSSALAGGSAEVKNYNQTDGFWVRLTAAAIAQLTPRYVITENAATTTAGQKLAPGRGKEILREVYDGQDILMMQQSDTLKRYDVTRAIYQNYYAELEANQGLESNRTMLLNGQPTLTYRGIPLKIVDVVDRYLATDFKFGTGANTTITNPHRVVLSTKDNLQVSLDTATKNPIAFRTWDDWTDKAWYSRGMYMLDTQIGDEGMISLGY